LDNALSALTLSIVFISIAALSSVSTKRNYSHKN